MEANGEAKRSRCRSRPFAPFAAPFLLLATGLSILSVACPPAYSGVVPMEQLLMPSHAVSGQSPPPDARSDAIAPTSSRLMSLDALRGFDMFWIMGGENIVHALAALTGWQAAEWGSKQLRHVEWDGFVFYDMIFPLF